MKVKDKETDRFSIGNLTGIGMAIDGLRVQSKGMFTEFELNDFVTFELIEKVPAKKAGYSDMLKFRISVSDM